MGPPGKSAVDLQFGQPFVGNKVSSKQASVRVSSSLSYVVIQQ